MVTEPDGEWVEYKDHLAVVAEKDAEIERLRKAVDSAYLDVYQTAWMEKLGYCGSGNGRRDNKTSDLRRYGGVK